MSRTALPLLLPDVAAFSRALLAALNERQALKAEAPGHVEMLNLVARAAGHRNYQALKAAPPAALMPVASGGAALPLDDALLEPVVPAPPAADDADAASPSPLSDNARKALAQFDSHGRLMRWPVKYSVQKLVMWVLWTRFDGKRVYTEAEVNAVLKAANLFFDHVTLRRELINHKLMARKSDCSEYRKLAARPDEEARALLSAWRARFKGA